MLLIKFGFAYVIITLYFNKSIFFIVKFYLRFEIIYRVRFTINNNYKFMVVCIFFPSAININDVAIAIIAYNIKTSVNPISNLQIH